ncbi:MAG: hypothetical protein ABI972_25695 [Acidobacteriota bacterium]
MKNALETLLDRGASIESRHQAGLAIAWPVHRNDLLRIAEIIDSPDVHESWLGSILGTELRSRVVTRKLISILLGSGPEHSKHVASHILARTRDRRAIHALGRTALDRANDEYVRAYAFDALSYMRRDRRVRSLLLKGLEDPAAVVTQWCLDGLARDLDEPGIRQAFTACEGDLREIEVEGKTTIGEFAKELLSRPRRSA